MSKPTFTITDALVRIVLRDDTGEHDELIKKLTMPEEGQIEPVFWSSRRTTTENIKEAPGRYTTEQHRVYLYYKKADFEKLRPYLEERADRVEAHPPATYKGAKRTTARSSS